MRLIIVLLSCLAVAACETTVNAQGPSNPELDPLIETFLENVIVENGENVGNDLIARGAKIEGNTVKLNFEARQDLSDQFRDASRGQVDSILRIQYRQDLCANAAGRALILAGGRVEMRIVDNIGRELSGFAISGC